MCKGCIAKLDELHLSGWHFISTGECHQIFLSGGFSTMCSRKRREFGCIRIQNWIFKWICKIVMTKIRIRLRIFRNIRNGLWRIWFGRGGQWREKFKGRQKNPVDYTKVKNAWIGDVLGVIFRGHVGMRISTYGFPHISLQTNLLTRQGHIKGGHSETFWDDLRIQNHSVSKCNSNWVPKI